MKYLSNIWILLALCLLGAWAFLKYAPSNVKTMVTKPVVTLVLGVLAFGALWSAFKRGNGSPAA